jgi:hypothetical protein
VGFQLGRALGKLAGSAIRTATHGLVRPSFNKPSARPGTPSIIATVPDSIVTTTQSGAFAGSVGLGTKTRQVQYISSYPVGGGANGGGGTLDGGMGGAGCPTGFRLNKSAYVTRGGGTSRWPGGLQLHEKGSTCVRRRKMNAGNGRAATHAVRRLVAFYRLSNRVAKQLRKAASKAHLGGRRGQRRLPSGRGSVEVVNVE